MPVKAEARELQRSLAPQQVLKFLLELLLIEQLPTRGAIEPGAQFGDAVFVGVLLLGLSGEQAAKHVVAECKISGGGQRPTGHDHHGADSNPERDRSESNLPSRVGNRITGATTADAPRARSAAPLIARDFARLSRCPTRH